MRFNHGVRGLKIAVHNTARLSGGQSAGRLLNHFQRERKWHWPVTSHTCFERLSLDELHGIEAFTTLLSVVRDTSDIGMTNLRSRACFTKKPRTRGWIFCHRPIDYFECDDGVQHRVLCAISYCHRSGAELNWKTVCADVDFEVGISQWSGCDRTTHGRSLVRFFALWQKSPIKETAQTLPVRTALCQWPPACRADLRSLRLRCFHCSTTNVPPSSRKSIESAEQESRHHISIR